LGYLLNLQHDDKKNAIAEQIISICEQNGSFGKSELSFYKQKRSMKNKLT